MNKYTPPPVNSNNSKKVTIVFLFPEKDSVPIGGYKIAYQYADFFSSVGYDVHLFYPFVRIALFYQGKISVLKKIKIRLGFFYRTLRKQQHAGEWFNFTYPIKKHFTFRFSKNILNKLPKNSIVFATAVETAYELSKITKIPNKNKFYIIQDFENWKGNTDKFVYDSYMLPLNKIVISNWLKKCVESTGASCVLIENMLDFDYFKLSNPIKNREATEIAMLYHIDDRKRCVDSMAALEIVKKCYPKLHVAIFGAPTKPNNLPEYYTYYQTPNKETHNKIYNTASIFIAASTKEGWGLPPAEAMQCGCAVCCTSIDGFEYAQHNKTALLSPIYDVEALAKNIIKLIENDSLRFSIAQTGNEYIQRFTKEAAFSKMKDFVEKMTKD